MKVMLFLLEEKIVFLLLVDRLVSTGVNVSVSAGVNVEVSAGVNVSASAGERVMGCV